MTREEAISTLESESCYECSWGCESPVKCDCPKCNLKSAVNMGIEALKETERNPTITSWHDFDRGYNIAKEKFNRPHGEWKRISMDKYIRHASCFYRCSVCGEDTIGETDFCPNCGASMISSNSKIEKSKSEIENSNLPERFTATDCSCLNCKNRHSVHCEPQNKKIYGYCGNWERR